jgi:hypothetical protein
MSNGVIARCIRLVTPTAELYRQVKKWESLLLPFTKN